MQGKTFAALINTNS